MPVKKFDNNDNEYLAWMRKHPEGYVVNTRRNMNSGYFLLHKSNCNHITTTSGQKQGAYTQRTYIKLCSENLFELTEWFSANNSNFQKTFTNCKTCLSASSFKTFKNNNPLYPEAIDDKIEILNEGAKKQVTINAYERNNKARKKCLEHHGYLCAVCNIDFEKVYGSIGKDFIHVHHLIEISKIGKEYRIDPVVDLIPVCPNCHSMLHRGSPCYTIQELKNRMKEQRGKM